MKKIPANNLYDNFTIFVINRQHHLMQRARTGWLKTKLQPSCWPTLMVRCAMVAGVDQSVRYPFLVRGVESWVTFGLGNHSSTGQVHLALADV